MSNNLIGKTLAGRYRVEDAIGRGGMAEVYKVFDTHRAVHLAMKVLREDIAQDRVFIRRFKREAQTLAALQHPNIVRLYGLEQDDLLVFMLMDYVEGTNLRAEILRAQGPLAPERVLEVMRPVCSALHYAHKQGVIHCDIKPGNIMIDKRGTVLVADFGIARAAEGATVTMVGVGTPAYMAPELIMGQAPTPQTDIYALGVMLYEMLTGGERPFTGEQAKTTGTTAEKVRWEQLKLKPPSPRTYNPAISPEVETVVLGCLAKKPERRYPAPLELLNALERATSGDLGAALPTPAGSPVAVPLPTEPLPPAPSYEPAARVVESAAAPRKEKVQARPAPTSARRGTPIWAWIGGAVVILGVIAGGLALSGILGGRAGMMPKPTQQDVASASTTQLSTISTNEPTEASTLTSTSTAGEQARALAEAGVTRNADWRLYTEEINGVLMALVPTGCFEMGSDNGASDERPAHKVCFELPFWIDVYEVTNSQFAAFGGQAHRSSNWTDAARPREMIDWGEADAFCHKRGVRLLTEAEWEYAARGPNGLTYPWGNDFVVDNAVYRDNNSGHTASVGSEMGGISWVGALDMSGNVFEWISDPYSLTYYGSLADGVINPQGPESGGGYGLRGGSWSYGSSDLRATSRNSNSLPSLNVGFRCGSDVTLMPISIDMVTATATDKPIATSISTSAPSSNATSKPAATPKPTLPSEQIPAPSELPSCLPGFEGSWVYFSTENYLIPHAECSAGFITGPGCANTAQCTDEEYHNETGVCGVQCQSYCQQQFPAISGIAGGCNFAAGACFCYYFP